MIRLILIILFLVFFVLISIPLLLVEWLIGKFNRHAKDLSSLRFVQWAFKVITWLAGVKLTVIGEENVPEDEPVLFVGNHCSFFDVIITYARCKNLTGYVAKKSFESVPILANWMHYLYCLFLDRDKPRDGVRTLLQASRNIENGISMTIYPEGTRNKTPEQGLLPFKEGSCRIATKANCTIIPMTMNNTRSIFEAHFPRVKKTHVILEYGTPIRVQDMDKEERNQLSDQVTKVIQETIQKNAADI